MKLRFEIQSLAALGLGPHRLPINCWRLTLNITGTEAGNVLWEGQDLSLDLTADAATPAFGIARAVVGGVFDGNGNPVNIDQVLRVNVTNGNAAGVLIYEYLEP